MKNFWEKGKENRIEKRKRETVRTKQKRKENCYEEIKVSDEGMKGIKITEKKGGD